MHWMKGRKSVPTPGGEQDMLCVTEQGLYMFVIRSDKPKALPFQKWLAGGGVNDYRARIRKGRQISRLNWVNIPCIPAKPNQLIAVNVNRVAYPVSGAIAGYPPQNLQSLRGRRLNSVRIHPCHRALSRSCGRC